MIERVKCKWGSPVRCKAGGTARFWGYNPVTLNQRSGVHCQHPEVKEPLPISRVLLWSWPQDSGMWSPSTAEIHFCQNLSLMQKYNWPPTAFHLLNLMGGISTPGSKRAEKCKCQPSSLCDTGSMQKEMGMDSECQQSIPGRSLVCPPGDVRHSQ